MKFQVETLDSDFYHWVCYSGRSTDNLAEAVTIFKQVSEQNPHVPLRLISVLVEYEPR